MSLAQRANCNHSAGLEYMQGVVTVWQK